MALVGNALAQELADALGQPEVSDQLKGWAEAIVIEVKLGMATFANVPSPHLISGLVGPRLAQEIVNQAGYSGTNDIIIAYSTAITNYIMASAIVTYTAPVPNPPAIPPSAAWFLNGTISGLVGETLAEQVAKALKKKSASPELIEKCNAIVNYIQANATVTSGVIS